MIRGIVNGFTRPVLLRYSATKPSSSVVCPPTQEPVTIAVRSRRCRRPLDAGVRDGFARGNHAELRKPVEQRLIFFVEVRGGS